MNATRLFTPGDRCVNRGVMNPTPLRRGCRFLSLVLAGFLSIATAAAGNNPPDWPTIAEQSTRQLEKNPSDERAWAKLVEARIMSADLKRAEKALADWRGKVAHPSAEIEKLEAELAVAREDRDGAIKAWKRYLGLEPKDTDAWRDVASLYAEKNDWRNAIEAISHALEQKQNADGFAMRASYRIRLHDWAAAEADVRAGEKIDATNDDIQILFPVFERKSEWFSAISRMDAELAKDPGNVRLHLDRAEWLAGEEFVDAAGDDVDAALKLDPKSLRTRVWHGIIAWENNDPEQGGRHDEIPDREPHPGV